MKVFLAPDFKHFLGVPNFSAKTLDLFCAIRDETGCRYLSFWATKDNMLSRPSVIASTLPFSWVMRYAASGFSLQDPTLTIGVNAVSIFVIDYEAEEREAFRNFSDAVLKANVGRYSVCIPHHLGKSVRTVTTLMYDKLPEDLEERSGNFQRKLRSIANQIVRELLDETHAVERNYVLSKRETEILRLVSGGMRYDEIAASLSISRWTVVAHMKSIKAKLGATSSADAVSKAIQKNIL